MAGRGLFPLAPAQVLATALLHTPKALLAGQYFTIHVSIWYLGSGKKGLPCTGLATPSTARSCVSLE